jgi:phosphotriesterase-related protein
VGEENIHTLQTFDGPIPVDELGLILPHEHLFTDLRGPSVSDYAVADATDVVRALRAPLNAAYSSGVTAIVECSTVGVGRNISILKALNEITPIHIVVPTGVYREGYIPAEMISMPIDELANLWIRELFEGIEETEIRAGFIKISVSDHGPTSLEERSLIAASVASQQTGAVVACHTANGSVFEREWNTLEKSGLDPSRFIWVHANLEPDSKKHIDAAKVGVFVEFDAIGATWQSQDAMIQAVIALLDAGYIEKILLSHDAGWYEPGSPKGEPEDGIRGYTALIEDFNPALSSRGVSKEEIIQITQDNPAQAFSLQEKG